MKRFNRRGAWRRPGGTESRVFPWGYMTPEHNFDAPAYYLSERDRLALGKNRVPYWHVVNFTLAGLQSLDDEILPTNNFIALALMGTATQGPGSYQPYFYQVENQKGSAGRPLSRVPVIERNAVGSGVLPWIFRALYPMQNLLSLMTRVQNRSTSANTVQLVMYGLQRKGVS